MKSEEQKELLRFVGILVAVVVVVLGVYFFTKKFITKEVDEEKADTPAVGTVNYDMAIVGNMLNKPEDDYYVFVYDSEAINGEFYKSSDYVTEYLNDTENENKLRIYYVELNDYFNKDYKASEDEESNPKAKTVEEFKFGDFTLVRVKKGKVNKYLETAEAIKKELNIKDEDDK